MCSFATLKAAMLFSKSRFGFADEDRDRGSLLARKNLTNVPQKEGTTTTHTTRI
ncbi:unnamed protein product [Pylaiella littoralis]